MARYKAWNGTQPPRECLRAAALQKSQQMRMGGGGVPLQQQYQPQTPNTPLGPQQQRVGPPLMHSPADDLVKNEPKAGAAQNAAAANQGSLVSLFIYRIFIRSVKFVV